MGLFGSRRSHVEVLPEQRWENISLGDFKSTSCFTPFAYGYVWFSLLLSIAVYGVDIFTAYQLIAFNRWSSEIKFAPVIPFDVAKWVFSICIILSFVNVGYEHIRARRIMNRGSVAESFMDSLCVRLESIRMGRGRGWKRFLVFAELTKSKKGAEIIALFTYFSFQSWIRVIICSGPRQVINAFTLLSLYNARLTAQGNSFEQSLGSFFNKIKLLAEQDYRQAVILSGMLFTLVVWVFAFLSLLLAAFFFVFYLWFRIPRHDGGLTGFCERKINKRLKQIVHVKINKAMADDERKRRKAELKVAMKNGEERPMTMHPSLPSIPNLSGGGEDKLPEMPMLSRADTIMTLNNGSRPGTPGSFELNALGQKRPVPSRTATMASSFSSRAPLLNSAADFGASGPDSPASSLPTPSIPSIPSVGMGNYPPSRTATTASNRSYGSGPQLNRMPSNGSSLAGGYATASPATYSSEAMPAFPAPIRSPTAPPGLPRGPGPNQLGPRPNPGPGRATYDDYPTGRASPAPSNMSYGSNPLSPRSMGPDGYPVRSATNPVPPRGPGPRFPAPQRNMTAPVPAPYQHTPTPSNGSYQHQPTASNGSLRNMPPPARPYHETQGSWDFGFGNNAPAGEGQGNGPARGQAYHQQQGSGDYDYFNRPATANSQRSGPRGGYGSGGADRWNQDVERGNGPRY